jgi:hypothetical protein
VAKLKEPAAPNRGSGLIPASRRQPPPQLNQIAAGNVLRRQSYEITYDDVTTGNLGEWENIATGWQRVMVDLTSYTSAATNSLYELGIAMSSASTAVTAYTQSYAGAYDWTTQIQWTEGTGSEWIQIPNPDPVVPIAPALSFERVQVINRKARELLLQHLNDLQRRNWLEHNFFDLMVPSGRRYRLKPGLYHNVFLLDQKGKEIREYCAYSKDPGGTLPNEDNVFAQMLTLQYEENEFLSKANTWCLLGHRKFVGCGVDAAVQQAAA